MNHLYAIVDIETTGGQLASGSITEIAILIHDGQQVVQRYETLIRPFYSIPRFISVLTGIDDEMVKNSPTFETVAEEIYELLKDKIFVAHNVNFDYSFLKHHLNACGYNFNAPKLCTVRLSRKIFPGLRSYSLGNICAYLNIDIANRHRAGGDADATAVLFQMLLDHDTEQVVAKQLKRNSGEQYLPPNLPKAALDQLPQQPGVYFFHDQKGKVIYIGKAVNIQKRVKSHFTGNKITRQRQDFLRDIHDISFECYPTELMALVAEAVAIKKSWPKYNRALKGHEPKYGLFSYLDQNDFNRLIIGKYNKSMVPLRSFHDLHGARMFMHQLTETYDLCPELCKIGDCPVCKAEPDSIHKDAEAYNKRVAQALEEDRNAQKSFFIKGKGRQEDEYSLIWVDPGAFYAMGYLPADSSFSTAEEVVPLLQAFEGSLYIVQLLTKYAKEHPKQVIYTDL
ncbi:MAG: hypothetical protein BGO31_01080 [Bacteroidetes bacterium 43-16]|nr:MAG: hypothetical protein BGO31_01080 [Bacteroidetes bacterium 43-16]